MVVILFTTNLFNTYRYSLSISFLLFLIILVIYSASKKNVQAYFILVGIIAVAIAAISNYLINIGWLNLGEEFKYLLEIAILFEVTLFSRALADKINHLKRNKKRVLEKLFILKQNATKKLNHEINKKIKRLKLTLKEKNYLLKELHHRVKNNIQIITTLIHLQKNELQNNTLQEIFSTAQNRINSMKFLHDILYKQKNIHYINAHQYFELLIKELKANAPKNIQVDLCIKTHLKLNQAIYCGLIVNELVSNSLYYAFENQEIPIISLSLTKEKNLFKLLIYDNGLGYDKNKKPNSFGLNLVHTLVTKQLKGYISSYNTNGVITLMSWKI